MKGHKNDYTDAVNVRMNHAMFDKIKSYSDKHGIAVSETVRRACTLFFFETERAEERKKKKPENATIVRK